MLFHHHYIESGAVLCFIQFSREKWLQRRRILTPAFHFNILKDFLDVFNEETEKFLNFISSKHSEIIDVVPAISEFALQSINQTAMGYKLDPNDKENRQYRHAIYEIGKLFKDRLATPWEYYPLIYIFTKNFWKERNLLKILHGFTRSVIKDRMNNFKLGTEIDDDAEIERTKDDDIYMGRKKKRLAMLDVLLEAKASGEQIDYEGICEEVDTFMFEGHDTTAAALGFCLMLIANHPEIQEHLVGEINSVLGHEKRRPTYNELQKMEFLERCIKESLRLYPSVHFISRKVDEDTTVHSGLTVPKNAIILIHIFDIHRNPEIYPEPDKFDPNRFLPENCQHRHPFAYIPFSAGSRNCIGQKFAMMEMKVFVAGILQQYKLEPVDTPETIVLEIEMLLRSKNGIKMKLIPRK